MARSSPIRSIKDNVLWLETSLGDSIDPTQAEDGSFVTSWHDQNISGGDKAVVSVVGTGPTYANTINYIHALKFSGSSANYLQVTDASFLNNTDYTIFVLEKRQSSASNNFFLGESSGTLNQGLSLGYSADSTVIHSQGGANSYNATVSSYNTSSKPRQFTFVHSATSGNSTYINGVLAAQDATKTAHLSGISTLAIGKGYTGEIGEIAIFTRAIKAEERQSVEDYYAKKWSRNNNRAVVPGGTCIGFTVTDSGCDLSSSTCSISISGLIATVSPTSSSTSLNCNQSNYSGSISYTCINGTANITGSCTAAAPCNGVTVTGVSAPVTLTSGQSDSTSCNVSHFTGTAAYSCNNGSLNVTTQCNCSAGYSGAGCSTCDSGNGYTSDGNGNCVKQCTYNVTGATPSTGTVIAASGTLTCNTASHYSSAGYPYTCVNGAAINGTCPCATGYTGSGCSTCDSANGYSSDGNGNCVGQCNVPAITGVSAIKAPQSAGGTLPCGASGYSGSISYTCDSNLNFSYTGSCNQACTGGTIDYTSTPGSPIHKFLSGGTFTCPTARTARVLVVGGGGGGAGGASDATGDGGGGGGGVVYNGAYSVTTTGIPVTIGAGGSAGPANSGNGGNGGNSIFGTITASGGGGGGGRSANGSTGASGGGGGIKASTMLGGTATQGNAGGNGTYGGGGGGGAGGPGTAGSTNSNLGIGGNGGIGVQYNISGTNAYYGGGGGGGYWTTPATKQNGSGTLTTGGGGDPGVVGTPNTGGGGGAADAVSTAGRAGGSGIVIVTY